MNIRRTATLAITSVAAICVPFTAGEPEVNDAPVKIELVSLTPFSMACIKHVSEDPMPTARRTMVAWAEEKKIELSPEKRLLGMNDFMKGPKNGYVFCIPVPEGTGMSPQGTLTIAAVESLVPNEVTIKKVERGLYVTIPPQSTMMKAWKTFAPLFKTWLKESGHENHDMVRQCFEVHVPRTRRLADLTRLSPEDRRIGYSVLIPVGKKGHTEGTNRHPPD